MRPGLSDVLRNPRVPAHLTNAGFFVFAFAAYLYFAWTDIHYNGYISAYATVKSVAIAMSPTIGVMTACAVLALYPLRRGVQVIVCIMGALTLGGTAMDAVVIVESPEKFFYADLAVLVTLFGIAVFQMVIVCAPLDSLLPRGYEKIVLDPNWV